MIVARYIRRVRHRLHALVGRGERLPLRGCCVDHGDLPGLIGRASTWTCSSGWTSTRNDRDDADEPCAAPLADVGAMTATVQAPTNDVTAPTSTAAASRTASLSQPGERARDDPRREVGGRCP